jgi:hypothetical protein
LNKAFEINKSDFRFLEAEDILKKHYETDMHFALGYGAMLTFQVTTYDII